MVAKQSAEAARWAAPLEVNHRGIVIDERDHAPFEKVDARSPRGQLLRSARIRRACALRSYGLLMDEIGWTIGVSSATASAYCWAGGHASYPHPDPVLKATFSAALELYGAGKVTWSWHVDGQPMFALWPGPAGESRG